MSKTIGQLENNAVELEFHQRVTDLYLAQPLRASCKLCEAPRSERGFVTGRVRYWLCSNCGHLNGSHEGSGRFSQAMYAGDLAADYASGYLADWTSRMESIYLPKAEFLLTALQGSDAAEKVITVLDVSCGAGHFLGAL